MRPSRQAGTYQARTRWVRRLLDLSTNDYNCTCWFAGVHRSEIVKQGRMASYPGSHAILNYGDNVA
eukprot:1868964-Rhodomonas_salina.3